MKETITNEEICNGIPEEFRRFFFISCNPIPQGMMQVVDSFWEATKLIGPKIKFNNPIQVIIGATPFAFDTEAGEFKFSLKENVIGACVDHFVFLDFNRVQIYKKEIQEACILEEFVHSLMRISDENFVKVVVSELHPKIRLVDGNYDSNCESDL